MVYQSSAHDQDFQGLANNAFIDFGAGQGTDKQICDLDRHRTRHSVPPSARRWHSRAPPAPHDQSTQPSEMEPEPESQLDVSVETQLSADGWASAERTEEGSLKDWEHKLPVEVFISDTDSYAIIYHTVYHKYFERARVELLGISELVRLRSQQGIALRELETRHIRFFDSGLLGDVCTVVTKLVELDATRIVMEHRFLRDSDQKMLTRGVCELRFIDERSGATVPVPPSILKGLCADPSQHIPKNAISSIFGGGKRDTPPHSPRVPHTGRKTPQPAIAAYPCSEMTHDRQSDEDQTPGLKNHFRILSETRDTTCGHNIYRNLNTELSHTAA